MNKFDIIKIGDKAELKHLITKKDIEQFVELTGDNNKLHVDAEYASSTTFKKPVVHGMLGASFISSIIGTKIPGDGSLWFSQKLDFLLPVRVGDEITVKAEVIKKIERDKVIELRTDIYNQHKQKVTAGTAQVKIIEQKIVEEKAEKKSLKKVALIVGATGGIGRATSIGLAKDGFDIIVHYHQNEKAAKILKIEIEKIGRKALVVRANITDNIQVKEMIESIARQFDVITVFVNCTTIKVANIKFISLDWQDIQSHIDINIKGSFYLIKHLLPLMEKQKYGKIINITTQAIEIPAAELLPYITAKSALNGFSKALALELAPKGINVNMVSPGMTETELISDFSEKAILLTEAKTPLKRLAKPDDIANAICFLASRKADFLTGETIRVNGGQVML